MPTVTDHLSNSLPTGAVNAHSGSAYSLFFLTSTASIVPVPPFALNVTFTLVSGVGGAALSFQIAVTVMLSLAITLSPGFFSTSTPEPTTTFHLSNSLPAGAVKPHTGSVYSLSFSTCLGAIVPLPPLALNITFTLPGAGGVVVSFQSALTVTLSLAITLSPGFLFTAVPEPTVTDHLSNSLPSGAVYPQTGNV